MQNFAKPVFILIAGLSLSGLFACGLNSQVKVTISSGVCSAGSIEASCAAQSSTALSLTGRRPLAIKSGDTVTLTGTGFNKAMSATIGGIPVTSLNVTSATSASLVVPPGVATGMSDLKLALTATEATASVAYSPAGGIPLMTVAASEVCAGVEFYDLNGDKQTGTKSCAGSSSTPECTANGSVGCVTTTSYKSADFTNLLASNIKSGVSVAGVDGNVTESPGTCSINGQQSCVASGSYFAGTACDADGSNCFLRSYSVPGFQTKKAVDVSTIDSTKMLDTLTVSGITGNVASRGSWNLTMAFPGEGFFTGVSNSPTAATIAKDTTITGVAGTATLTPANCSANGQQSCVAAGTFFAGAACAADGSNCFLPSYSVPGLQTKKAVDVSTIDPWDLRAGISAAGVSGQLKTNCRNGGSTLSFGMGAIKSATVANGADTLTVTSHGYETGTVVWIDYTTQPTGLSRLTNYYVIRDDNDSFKLATSAANAFTLTAINITADGLGVIVWQAGATAKPATAVDPTNYTISVTGHGYSSTQVVQVSYKTWPGGPSTSTNYYVIVVDKDTIKLATSPSNAKYGVAIHITTIGSDVYVYSLGTGTLSVSDTIEDFNSFGEILTSHPWSSSNNFCDGVEAIAGDSNVWKDTSGGGCTNNSSNCRMKDKISGLEWTKMQSVSLNWGKAMDLCNGLTVDSVPGWRLPTQKELMDAYNHGIRSAGSTNWISKSTFDANYFWSASTVSANFGGAWSVHLAYGRSNDFSKSGTYQVVCVR